MNLARQLTQCKWRNSIWLKGFKAKKSKLAFILCCHYSKIFWQSYLLNPIFFYFKHCTEIFYNNNYNIREKWYQTTSELYWTDLFTTLNSYNTLEMKRKYVNVNIQIWMQGQLDAKISNVFWATSKFRNFGPPQKLD
jgi:Ni/Fe-hydrogenase subunit HybB-like protein